MCMIHDMAITEHYSIIGFYPAIIDLTRIFQPGPPLIFDKSKPAKFAVFPRHFNGETAIQYFEIKSCMAFHYINAFETIVNEDETLITIDVCVSDSFDLNDLSSSKPYPSRFVLNLKRGQVQEEFGQPFTFHSQDVSDSSSTTAQNITTNENMVPMGEFPVIHPSFTGKPYRYFYYSVIIEKEKSDSLLFFNEIAKFDLETKTLKRLKIPENGKIGEVCLVPKKHESIRTPPITSPQEEEDNVYLVTFAFHEEKNSSSLFIFDGKTMSEEPVCQIELPRRVPFGFHGQFFPATTFEYEH